MSNPFSLQRTRQLRRCLLRPDDAPGGPTAETLFDRGKWPCSWIHADEVLGKPGFILFRIRFDLEQPLQCRLHISGDERYRLFIDGVEQAEGQERGDLRHWFFDSYKLSLEAGEHTFVVQVFALGGASMRSQMSLRPGLIVCPESEPAYSLFATGVDSAKWEYALPEGYRFTEPFKTESYSVGWNCEHDGRLPGAGINDADLVWKPVCAGLHGAHPEWSNRNPATHLLYPATLPEMSIAPLEGIKVLAVKSITSDMREPPIRYAAERSSPRRVDLWQRFLDSDESLEIEGSKEAVRILLDLGTYACADVILGLGRNDSARRVSVQFAESLFMDSSFTDKGQRNEFEGKFFRGIGDRYIPDANESRWFKSVHWRSGRFVEIEIEAGVDLLRILDLKFLNRCYPLRERCRYDTGNESLSDLFPLALNTIRASSHDSLVDGPYYEQMCWIGDCPQVSQVHYVISDDVRLVRKALQTFDVSRMKSGMIRARWPARDSMVIVPFACHLIHVSHGYALWRDDLEFVRSLMPGLRHTVDAMLAMRDTNGLIAAKQGWTFIDWVPEWGMGIAPGADGGVNACLNWNFVYSLGLLAEMEAHFGEMELATRFNRISREIATKLCELLWVEEVGLFADTLDAVSFSEHGQIFAILSGLIPYSYLEKIDFGSAHITARASVSYSHYLCEAHFRLGRHELLLEKMESYRVFKDRGLLTLPEQHEPSRSDCHAWTAHPLYHYYASLLGIRPVGFGFKKVEIRPMLQSSLRYAGSIPHPKGEISVAISAEESGSRSVTVSLPDGLPGVLFLKDESHPILNNGTFSFETEGPSLSSYRIVPFSPPPREFEAPRHHHRS